MLCFLFPCNIGTHSCNSDEVIGANLLIIGYGFCAAPDRWNVSKRFWHGLFAHPTCPDVLNRLVLELLAGILNGGLVRDAVDILEWRLCTCSWTAHKYDPSSLLLQVGSTVSLIRASVRVYRQDQSVGSRTQTEAVSLTMTTIGHTVGLQHFAKGSIRL